MRAAPLRKVSSAPPNASVKRVAGSFGKAPRSARRLSINNGIGKIASIASVNSGSTSSAMLWARARKAPALSTISARASSTIARPASVSRGVLCDRSNSEIPSVVSSV